MQGIERRAKGALSGFTLLDPERYTSLEFYESSTAEFRECLRRLLPAEWSVGTEPGTWCHALPPERQLPDTGFKIHVSTVHDRALELLERVLPILVDEHVAFKVLVDARILDLSNSHTWGRGACGKFITVYPWDVEHLKRLMRRLHAVTADLPGPYILSDKRLPGSHVLFYRYGAFRGALRLNAYGEREPYLKTDDGRLLPDPRPPYFVLPEGVADPFPEEPRSAGDRPLLHGRYRALAALGTSAKGGVYRCLDLQTQREVVIKEARPWVNRGRMNPHDAVACLHNEWEILQRLRDSGVTPRPLDFFQEWEHSFLVMELARGRKLSAIMASGELSLMARGAPTAERLRHYGEKFLHLARQLIAAVRAVHAQGVVIQDLSPNNILFDAEADRLTLIDFEAALDPQAASRAPVVRLFTPGFGTALRAGESPTVEGDLRALSRILGEFLYPPTPFFSLAPHLRTPMFEWVAREKGIPEAFVRLVSGVEEQPERTDALLSDAERSLESVHSPLPLEPSRDEAELKRLRDRIADYVLAKMSAGSDPLDLPTDYRRFTTNRLSAAYGASGIALFLHRVGRPLPPVFLDALLREARAIDNAHYAPGLYLGSAGVAWTLLELGQPEEARAVLKVAENSPLLFDSADLFYGAAGHGLTQLFFFERLGDERHLQAACRAFEGLEPRLQRAERGLFFESGGDVYHSLAHGASGVAWFLLKLHQATGRAEVLDCARSLLEHDLSSAESVEGQLRVRRSRRERVHYPYWQIGAAGVASVALRFHAVLGEPHYLEQARAIAASLVGNYSVFPTNFLGMVGLGELFVDLHQHTGEESYRTEARRFVDRIMLFALERPEGLVFPGEDLVRVSTDYGTGSAGTGLFIHRLLEAGGLPYLDF